MDLSPYQQEPRYQRLRLLGEGATGSVYLARRKSDDFIVALKCLRVLNYTALRELQLEANNYYRQQECPYVVDLLDYDVSLGQGFLFSAPRPLRPEATAPATTGTATAAASTAARGMVSGALNATTDAGRLTGNAALVRRAAQS